MTFDMTGTDIFVADIALLEPGSEPVGRQSQDRVRLTTASCTVARHLRLMADN
jgi:hypothetical protein